MLPPRVPSTSRAFPPHWISSPVTGVYDPKTFLPHAASLRQSFDHCARFPTAASRRSLGRISVPMWLIILSDQLGVVGLVSHYPTNYLIPREPLEAQSLAGPLAINPCRLKASCGISRRFHRLSPTPRQVAHVLRTRPPLLPGPKTRKPYDLHVLSAPPAFVLSQDQTLH